MTPHSATFSNPSEALKRLGPVVLILILGASLTVYQYFENLNLEDQRIQRKFDYAVIDHVQSLRSAITHKLTALRSMQLLFSYSKEVTRDEFEGASSLVMLEDPGIVAVEWLPIVQRHERKELIERARSYGYADFRLHDVSPTGELIPAAEADEYYPIFFVYPLEENRAALGLNVRKLATRQELQVAVQTGQAVCSNKFVLVQNSSRKDGWILSLPVYESGHHSHPNKTKPTHAPKGFLQAVIYLDDLLLEAATFNQHEHIAFTIADITTDQKPTTLWSKPAAVENFSKGATAGRVSHTVLFPALQRQWQITYRSTPQLEKSARTRLPFYILITGCAITSLLAAFTYHLLLIKHEVEIQVRERTLDLQAANEQLNREIIEHQKSEEARSQLEEQLRHVQKMEAIGTLAGGIAHDFNNILAAILGYIELIKSEVEDNKLVLAHISEVQKAGFRARDLVRQILTFSRQKEQKFQLIEPSGIVGEAITLVRASIPMSIDIQLDLDPNTSYIKANPTQIHQVVVNLATNASHAIGNHTGWIKFSLRDVTLTEPSEGVDGTIPPGSYVRFTIRDNGVGISQEILDRIYEPYFTTKETGQGTGMGLSMVHGIVLSHLGHITTETALGIGTSFNIYFPAQQAPPASACASQDQAIQGTGQLVVILDDEEAITELIEMNLVKNGFRVAPFNHSPKCLHYLETCQEPVSLLITDFAMPELDGLELIQIIRKLHPDLPIIVYSGQITPDDQENFEQVGVDAVLHKPISFAEMNRHIEQVIH